MSIALVLLMAAASVAAALVLLSRLIGARRILRHATLIDVGFAVLAGIALHSSIIGVMIAILGGLVMALVLQSGRLTLRVLDTVSRPFRNARKRSKHEDNWAPLYGWGKP